MTSGSFGDGLFGAHAFGAGPAGPGPVVSRIQFIIEAAFGSYPSDASYTWTQIHDTNDGNHGYVRAVAWQRGLNDLLSRTETGTGTVVLKDAGMYLSSMNRAWDPENTASPFYPHVKPGLPVRATATVSGVDYPLFQHFFDGFPRARTGPNYVEISAPTTDGFARLALASPSPDYASLVVDVPGINNTILYTAVNPGMAEEDITIQYFHAGKAPLQISVTGRAIKVRYHQVGFHGDPDHIASDVITAINADASASKLVVATNGPGSDGTGTVGGDFGPTPLAGGNAAAFPQEASGARINRSLDMGGWPAALRQIATGTVDIGASPFSSDEQGRLLSHVLDVAGEPGEFGMAFVDGGGRCVFLDRNSLYTNAAQATVAATFSDNRSDGFLTYTNSQPNFDRQHVINEWVGTRDGGVAQIVRDDDSIAKYGRTSHSVSSLLTNDTAIRAAMEFGRDEYGVPVQRLQSITVRPGNNLTAWTTCLGLELGDRVRVLEHPPGGGTPNDHTYIVMNLAAQVGPDPVAATFTFGLWPVRITNYFVWDDATFGNLDTTVLAYN